MANLTNSFLQAISTIVNKSIEEASSDRTIKATIKQVVDTFENKYLVTNSSGDFYVYAQSGSNSTYKKNEQVYILVPEGDMSQKKFIIGKVDDEKNQDFFQTAFNSSLQNYVPLGDNVVIDDGYGTPIVEKRMQPLSLNTQNVTDFYYCYLHDKTEINELSLINYDSVDYPVIKIDEEAFKNSAKQAKAVLIRANFKTDSNITDIGHYGIIVNIAFEDKTNPQIDQDGHIVYAPKIIAYVLDTTKMTGNPMRFYDYTSQYIVSTFDGANYLYIDSIIAFSEGFVTINTEENINVYIDKFEIIALDEISAINGDYKLRLTTPWGNTIKEGKKNNLKIIANVTYLNQDITSEATFYWGIKDPSIVPSSKDYHGKLGLGYRYIDIQKNELILTSSDLSAIENNFLCVAIYKSDIILKTSVMLYNNNNNIEISIISNQGNIFQFNEGNPILTCLINGRSINYQENYFDTDFSFIWSKQDNENGNVLLDKTVGQLMQEKEEEIQQCNENNSTHTSNAGRDLKQILSYYSTQIAQVQNIEYLNGIRGSKIRCSLKDVNEYVTYSCSVYRNKIYVGYGSITLQNSKKIINNNYYVTITNGTQVFQYDETGIAPNSIKQTNPIEILDLVAVFHSPQGVEVVPKEVRWIVPQENTLINTPTLGLRNDINGERCYIGDTYPLNIKEYYDNNCYNNQVIAVVTHKDGSEYRQASNLLFTKIGEIGTNGTDTVLKINELINIPEDECLTFIKDKSRNNPYNTKENSFSTSATPVLQANLYSNNNQVLGHTTYWTIAGTSNTKSYCYDISTTNEGYCKIRYNDDNNNEQDIRIVKAQTSFNGKYFHSFYGIPTIEYSDGYSYDNYKIKILRDKTLRNVLYDSNGTNPSYNTNQGVHIKLDWPQEQIGTGYLRWNVESGPKDSKTNNYYNYNFLISKTANSKSGSLELERGTNLENIQNNILAIQDADNLFLENINKFELKDYVNNFLTDIKEIGIDNILSISSKLNKFQNRLETFWDNTSELDKSSIGDIYHRYEQLFEIIKNEYNDCQSNNENFEQIYNNIQKIWTSEWPSIITEDRMHLKTTYKFKNIEELNAFYKKVYDDRSNDSINASKLPNRGNTFDNTLNNYISILDNYYNSYINNNDTIELDSILIEYAKILMSYLFVLIDETKILYEDNNEIKNRYNFIYDDWDEQTQTIGEKIYNSIVTADGTAAGVYTNIRDLYFYYQNAYLNVKKYQIVEESETLNVWNAMLNGEDPNLLDQIYIIPNDHFNGLYMNNNVVGTVFIKDGHAEIIIAKIYIPIIMTLNTYELSSINGWDGTTVKIGDDYIMTPQIGAGVKDDTTNLFTGMVMGAIENTADKINKVGLLGYSNGKQSVFIDSKTGRACFGLPEDDINIVDSIENDKTATVGTNEGRIELIPGGISKIGNWKIGSRFLYNIVDGNYERRIDKETRIGSKSKMLIPHDKRGIILSADQPYIHIKGENYDEKNFSGIDYKDEYNSINPGDSLELRMDPNNKSLFSIIQHTIGFGDENNEDLLFGYRVLSNITNENKITIKDYIANQNTEEEQNGEKSEYYIYKLNVDVNNKPVFYYKNEDISNLTRGNTWRTRIDNCYYGEKILSEALNENNFKSIENGVFEFDQNEGIIKYHPSAIEWKNEEVGISNQEGWSSVTTDTTVFEELRVSFNYNEVVSNLLETEENKPHCNQIIGKINNNHNGYNIYKMKIKNCSLKLGLEKLYLTNTANNYVRFYLVEENNSIGDINDALLVSDKINILDNKVNTQDIELFSYNNRCVEKGTSCWLKIQLGINSFIIDGDWSSPYIRATYNPLHNYRTPSTPLYGYSKIDTLSTTSFIIRNIYDSSIDGLQICFKRDGNNFKFYLFSSENPNMTFDFIFWRHGDLRILGGGQVTVNENSAGNNIADFMAFFIKEEDDLIEESSYGFDVSGLEGPSVANPWYINFYPEGTYISKRVDYNYTSSINDIDGDGVEESYWSYEVIENNGVLDIQENIEETIIGNEYTITENIEEEEEERFLYTLLEVPMNNIKKDYTDISFGSSWEIGNDPFNKPRVSWEITINNINFDNIVGLIPDDNENILCVEGAKDSFQGIPYVITYWDENSKQRIKFFKDYYNWINHNNKTQYGYINIVKDNDIYYKYISTLKKQGINTLFENNNLTEEFVNHSSEIFNTCWNWIDIAIDSDFIKENIYWKEFTRIGLDENGRLFNVGSQDKKTYSRTGRMFGFGKVPKLYGQEIRVEGLSSTTYTPIIKIFAEETDNLETTYITQNEKNNGFGNISIRTAKNGYVELAASEFSSNTTNSIPDKRSYVKVNYKDGIEIQVNNENNRINLNNNLIIKTNSIEIKSNNISDNFSYNIDNDHVWIKSLNYTISSRKNKDSILNFNDYKIVASSGENPSIKLNVKSNNNGLNITANTVELKSGQEYYIKIDNNNINNGKTLLKAENMSLEFNYNDKIAIWKNNKNYIKLTTDINNNSNNNICLYSFAGSQINIADSIILKNNTNVTIDTKLMVNDKIISQKDISTNRNIYIGVDNKFNGGSIFLYDKKNDNQNQSYIKISKYMLQQLFDWYNNYRWLIGCYGNTLMLRSIGGNEFQEGYSYYDTNGKECYRWEYKKFTGYSGNN